MRTLSFWKTSIEKPTSASLYAKQETVDFKLHNAFQHHLIDCQYWLTVQVTRPTDYSVVLPIFEYRTDVQLLRFVNERKNRNHIDVHCDEQLGSFTFA